MKLPKKIKIAGHVVEIKIEPRGNHGNTNPASSNVAMNKIWIDSDWSDSQQESSLIHEIVEYINYIYGLKLEHDKITVLETALYQIFKDNKLKF